MSDTTLSKKIPLNCPFCDEIAYPSPRVHRLVTNDRIFTQRQCIMGHIFYSVESIPENQNEVVEEMRQIKYVRDQLKHPDATI